MCLNGFLLPSTGAIKVWKMSSAPPEHLSWLRSSPSRAGNKTPVWEPPWDEELSSPHHHGTGRMGFGGRAPALQRGLFFPALPSLIQLLSPALVWGKKGVFGVWLQVWGFFSPVST